MPKIKSVCPNCLNEFEHFSCHKRIFCSKKCYSIEDSKRKKEFFSKNVHHNKGRKHSDDWKIEQSKKIKGLWKNEEFKNKVKLSLENKRSTVEVPLGWDEKSKQKREETNILRYNKKHNWEGKYGTRSCDKTFENKYGMTSQEYRTYLLRHKEKTVPEINFENFLISIEYNYEFQYKFKNRYFDFCLKDLKILIEIDGEYWHGKDTPFDKLNEQQKTTFFNDRYKENLVKKSDWKLIRIWDSEIKNLTKESFEKLCQK